jgi:uncharacterized protein (DUF302 family)
MSGFTRHIEINEAISAVKEKLLESINRNGFVIAGVSDLQEVFPSKPGMAFKSYVCYEVYAPWVYREILLASTEAELVPCTITIRENKDTINISVINTTMMMLLGVNNPRVKQALDSLDNLLEKLIKEISKPINFLPDLDTSAE